MASIHCLPSEILLGIFSSFEIYELFAIEKVCQRWRSIISEFVWSRVTRIDGKMIDYPHGNFSMNLIEINRRVESIQDIFTETTPLPLVPTTSEVRKAANGALLQLLRKISSDGVLFLDLVQDYLFEEFSYDLDMTDPLPLMADVRRAAETVSRELEISKFTAMKAKRVFVYGLESGRDPLQVFYKGRELPVPLDWSRITRLVIGGLFISIRLEDSGSSVAARSLLSRISSFPNLETIELESVDFQFLGLQEGDDSLVTVTLFFRSNKCKFSIDEFLSLLVVLGEKKEKTRNPAIIQWIDEWKAKDWIETGRVSIHSARFAELIFLLVTGNARRNNLINPSSDLTLAILSKVFPALITKLHLNVYYEYENEELLINTLEKHGLFNQLDEFHVSLTDQNGEEDNFSEGTDIVEAAKTGRAILRRMSTNMHNLESVCIDFSMGGDYCLRTMLTPLDVLGPLPRLRKLVHHGLVCFPFVVSVVEQAPGLRQLIISCHQFEDERAGVEWIKRLLIALEGCRSLCGLSIGVDQEEEANRGHRIGRVRLRGRLQKNRDKDGELLQSIESQLNRLATLLPKLREVSVTVDTCDFRFELSR